MGELSWIAEVGVGSPGALAAGKLVLGMLRDGIRSGKPSHLVFQSWGMDWWLSLVWELGSILMASVRMG